MSVTLTRTCLDIFKPFISTLTFSIIYYLGNFELENESPKCGDLLSIIVTPKEGVIADKAMCAQVSKNDKRINRAISRDLTSPLEIKFAAPGKKYNHNYQYLLSIYS